MFIKLLANVEKLSGDCKQVSDTDFYVDICVNINTILSFEPAIDEGGVNGSYVYLTHDNHGPGGMFVHTPPDQLMDMLNEALRSK